MSAEPLPAAPRPGFTPTGLVFQLFFLLVLPVTALLLLVTFGSLALHQDAMRSMVGERDERAVQAIVQILNDNLSARSSAIYSLALRAGDHPLPEYTSLIDSSTYLLPEFDTGIAFLDAEGRLLAASGDPLFWNSLPPDLLAGPVQDSASGRTHLSAPLPYPGRKDTWIVVALAPVPGQNSLAAGAFTVRGLAEKALSDAPPPHRPVYAFLVDQKQRLIYQAGNLRLPDPIQSHAGVAEALQGDRGRLYQGHEGMEKVIVFSPVSLPGWALVLEEPWEEATSPLLRTTIFTPLVLVPVLLLAMAALWFATRQVIKPMQALAAKTANLSRGEFGEIEEPVGGIIEIRHLQQGIVDMARKVQAAQQNLHSYIGSITAAQEEERRRLARELHDDTIQSLIALKQRVQILQMDVQEPAPQPSLDETIETPGQAGKSLSISLDEIEELTEQTVVNLRRMTRDLRPIYLEDLGLVTALEMLAAETEKKSDIAVQFQSTGIEKRLPAPVELALYRIAQEALNNTARHAQASRAALHISFSPHSIALEVFDNGRGFHLPDSPAGFAPQGHYGLLGIHERAELIGASLLIDSSPGRGTQLSVLLAQ